MKINIGDRVRYSIGELDISEVIGTVTAKKRVDGEIYFTIDSLEINIPGNASIQKIDPYNIE